MRTTQVSSGLTTTQALISVPGAPCAAASPMPKGNGIPSARPPPAAGRTDDELAAGKIRGGGCPWSSPAQAFLLMSARHVHGRPDALVGAAAADVRHGLVDVGVGRQRLLREERRGRHDLPDWQ